MSQPSEQGQPGQQASKKAYEQFRRQGGTGPQGQPLPEWDQADDQTKQHVASMASQPGQPQ